MFACIFIQAFILVGPPHAMAASETDPKVAVDHSKALDARRWTEVVQAVLKRQAGVPFAPKDLRSSFITFLLSDAKSDEALKKAVAHAMHHSTAQQGSAAYDKGRAERSGPRPCRWRARSPRASSEARTSGSLAGTWGGVLGRDVGVRGGSLCAARAALGWDHAGTWVTLVSARAALAGNRCKLV